jgi:hypothetical protein
MIFKQIDEILEGRKTQTRRIFKPGEMLIYADLPDDFCPKVINAKGVKWQVGRTYAVVPKRGQPAVWWSHELPPNEATLLWAAVHNQNKAAFAETGWQPMRIRITAIRPQTLQDITEADARAEGVESVAAYRDLWESINGRTPGARWADNPAVWVLTFELVR